MILRYSSGCLQPIALIDSLLLEVLHAVQKAHKTVQPHSLGRIPLYNPLNLSVQVDDAEAMFTLGEKPVARQAIMHNILSAENIFYQ